MDRACEKAKSVIESHSDSDWGAQLPPNPHHGEVPRFAVFFAITDHTAHHRGALTVYSRQTRLRAADALHGNVNAR